MLGISKMASLLIEAGVNPYSPNSQGWKGSTPLFVAAMTGHIDVIKSLVRAKADPLFHWPWW